MSGAGSALSRHRFNSLRLNIDGCTIFGSHPVLVSFIRSHIGSVVKVLCRTFTPWYITPYFICTPCHAVGFAC